MNYNSKIDDINYSILEVSANLGGVISNINKNQERIKSLDSIIVELDKVGFFTKWPDSINNSTRQFETSIGNINITLNESDSILINCSETIKDIKIFFKEKLIHQESNIAKNDYVLILKRDVFIYAEDYLVEIYLSTGLIKNKMTLTRLQ